MKEVWKPVVGYEGVYEVSSLGKVRSLSRTVRCGYGKVRVFRGRILKPHLQNAGYLCLHLAYQGAIHNKTVHRIVAESFCHKPPGRDVVNHINGNKLDNSAVNLEWCTPSDNARHALAAGLTTIPKGSRKGAAKLSESDIPVIRDLLSRGMLIKDVASLYGIAATQISLINSGKAWTHVA